MMRQSNEVVKGARLEIERIGDGCKIDGARGHDTRANYMRAKQVALALQSIQFSSARCKVVY